MKIVTQNDKNIYDQVLHLQNEYYRLTTENYALKRKLEVADEHNGKVYPTIHHLFEHKNKLEKAVKVAFEYVLEGNLHAAAATLRNVIDEQV